MATSKKTAAKRLGYEVEEAALAPKAADGSDADGFWTTYRVRGFGLDLLIREDDADVWASLLDKHAHAERKRQHGETLEQTRDRLHAAERKRLKAEGLPLGPDDE